MALSRTRADLLEYAYQNILGGSIDDVSRSRAVRGIERALEMIALERRFSFLQSTYDIVTTPDVVFTSSLSINHAASTVSDSGSGIPDTVGAFFEFNGERHWYEMTARASAASATIRQTYTNESATNLSGVSGKLLYPLYDLPDDFIKERALFDTSTGDDIDNVPYDAFWWSKMERIGQGEPEWYTIMASRNDPNQWQLGLMPAPDTTKRYQLVYFRKPGWYDSATVATATRSNTAPSTTAGDAYYVDWPDQLMGVLEAAVLAAVAKEIKPSAANSYRQIFDNEINKAAGMDNKTRAPLYLSRGGRRRRGMGVDF